MIDLEVAASAVPQRVVLDQNTSGGVFPCTTSIQGALRAADTVEVDGAASESISAGSTLGGSGLNLNSCGTVGTITGVGTYRMLAGSGSMTLSAAGGAAFVGPLTIPVVLGAADGSSASFVSGSAQTTIDFSQVTSAVTVNVSGQIVAATANDSATAGGSTDTWTRNGPLAFVGAPTPTTFYAGTHTDSFQGSGAGQTTLDYSNASGSSLRVCVVAASGCTAGQALLGVVVQAFSGITKFVGLAVGNTTFVTAGTSGEQFAALGAANAMDASPAAAGTTVDSVAGTVTGPGSTTPDSFTGITHFVGSNAGMTTFVASSASESFVDPSAAPGDAIDFSNVPASAGTPLLVNVSGGPAGGGHANDTATVGAATYDFTNGGAGFTTFTGSNAGRTTFFAGPQGGYTFTGHGSTNSLDLNAASAGINLDAATGTVSGLTSGTDSLGDPTAFASFTGSAAGGTTFDAGAAPASVTLPGTGNRFIAATSPATVALPGAANVLDFSHLATALTVNVSGQTIGPTANDTATAGASTYTWTTASPLTFVGAAAPTTFFAGSRADSFQGTAAAQASLSYADAPGTSLHLCVVAVNSCNAGQALLGAVTQQFSGITQFFGLAAGNTTFSVGDEAGYDLHGTGSGNVLDVTAASTPVVDVPGGIVSGLAGSGHDTFTGIGFFAVDLYYTSPAPTGALVGGSYHPMVPGTGSSQPVVITVDAATTNAACSIDGSGTVQLLHAGLCVLDANQPGDSQFATPPARIQQFSVFEPTTMSFAASTGYPTLMHGILKDGTGSPVAGKVVRLERRYSTTGSWALVGSATTNSAGSVSLNLVVGTKAYYRIRFLGDSGYAGSASTTLLVKVYTKTRNTRTTSGLRATLLTGSNNRIKYMYLILQQRPVGARRWSNVGTYRTNRVGTITIRKNPTRRTDYRWRFAGTASYDGNYSPVVRLS